MRTLFLLPLAAAVVSAQPACAGVNLSATALASGAEDLPGSELLDAQVRLFYDEFYRRNFAEALAAASRVKSDGKEGRATIAAMRAAALLGLKRGDEARQLFAEAERLAPDDPSVTLLQFEAGLMVDHRVAGAALDRLLARFPKSIIEYEQQNLWYYLRHEPEGEERRNEDRRVALARLGFEGSDGVYLASQAIGILIKRGDLAAAAGFLPAVTEPQLIENMLIQKRYSALWPKIQETAGPGLDKVRAISAAAAERAYDKDPSAKNLQLLANALRSAGRLDDAISLQERLPPTPEAMASADEQTGWAVNNVALALHHAGRANDAERLFAMLNSADIKEGGWRVSMVINRLELLVADGQYDKAAGLLETATTFAKNHGTPYSQQLVRRLKYCTMSGLGRKDDAAKLLPDVLKHAEDAPGPTVDGLLCAGDVAKAEEVALSMLKKPAYEEEFVRQLQARPLTSDDPSAWQDGWKKLRARPAIAKEFERLGRDMPQAYLPPSGSRKT